MHRYADSLPLAGQARIAGFCSLFVIAGGTFAALFVREALFAPGDAAATARAIHGNQTLWRWGIAGFSSFNRDSYRGSSARS